MFFCGSIVTRTDKPRQSDTNEAEEGFASILCLDALLSMLGVD